MRTSGLKALMVAQVFRSIAFGMVSMFGVVFIYSLGDSLMQGLTFMLYFFVFQRMVTIFTLPLSGYLTSRWGYRWTMLGGLLAVVGKLGVLTQVEVFNVGQLFWAALFGGIGMSSYWLGYHGVMLDDNEDSRVGEQEGQLQALKRGSIIVGPILAGFLVEWFGFSIMFIVAMGMFMLAAIPLFLMPRHKLHKDGFSVRKMIRLMKSEKRVWWSVWGRFFQESVQDIFWPVYLFLVIKSFSTFGLVNGGVLILNVVAVIVAGKMYDKRPLRRGFPLAGFLISITWFLRFGFKSVVGVVGADGLNRVMSPFWWMKTRRNELMVGENSDSVVFGAVHEVFVSLAMISGIVAGYLLMKLGGGEWLWLVLPAVVGLLVGTGGANGKKR